MAVRSWARLLGVTLGVGVLAGASQLGLAYGLSILRLTRVLDMTQRDQWTAQLAWVAWYAMTAAVVGALAGRTRLPDRAGAGTRIVTSLAAGLGAAVVVPLTMQPARTAQVAGVQPIFVIAVCAGLGALVGVFAAYAALSRAVARWSLITVSVVVWIVAIASVAPSLAPAAALPAVRLGVFDAGFLAPSVTQRTALFTMPALALICGAVIGWAARRRAMSTLAIGLSGLPGPALLTLAYLIAGPGAGAERYQVVPYWAAMTATGAGVLGSVLAAVVRRGSDASARPPTPDEESPPTPDRPPLPRRDAPPHPTIAHGTSPAQPPGQSPSAKPGAFARTPARAFDGFRPAKGRAHPQAVSAPLPHPEPIGPPPVAPPPLVPPPIAPVPARASAPAPAPTPGPVQAQAARRPAAPPAPRGRGKKQKKDGEIVDWVSGLGSG